MQASRFHEAPMACSYSAQSNILIRYVRPVKFLIWGRFTVLYRFVYRGPVALGCSSESSSAEMFQDRTVLVAVLCAVGQVQKKRMLMKLTMDLRRPCSLLIIALLAMSLPSLMAQSAGTAGLTGTVTDPSGAGIPNVTVTAVNAGTGQSRTVTSGQDGSYKFSLLQPGTYTVRFVATGFKPAEVSSVALNVTETPTLDHTMEVGTQSEAITVQALAETLQTQSSTLGTTVGSKTVTALPLSNRNYTQILGMAAGVNANVNNATTFGKATTDYAVNGADPGQNNYQMDGVAINNIANGGSSNDSGIYAGIPIPNPDAIQEFKIQTSTYDASYGRNPGANVNVITKSGSNAFHGSLWEFFRNEDLNANDFFENRDGGGKQQILRQNQPGGAVGGPIKKDKLFFYANYQETRQLNGVASQGTESVVLAPLPAGDRSAPGYQAAVGAALCPANHPGQPAYSTLFGAIIPGFPQVACDGSNISPVSMKILQIKLPGGNYYIPGSGTGNYSQTVISDPATYNEHQLILNGDYLINSKNTLAMRYLYTNNPQILPLSGGFPGAPANTLYTNTDAILKLTTVVKPSLVNELRASVQRNVARTTDTTPATPQQIGMTPIIPQETEMTPLIVVGIGTIGGTLAPDYSPTTQMQFADQISWMHGRHTFRAGYEFEDTQWNVTFGGLERGLVIIGSFADLLIGRGGCNAADFPARCNPGNPGNTTGLPVGDILQCLFCTRSGPGGLIHAYRLPNQNAFFQDDWKVTSRLTVNLGVRWEYDGIFSDKYGNLTNIWPSELKSAPVPDTAPTNIFNPGAAYLAGNVVPNNYLSHYGQPPTGVLISNRSLPVSSGPPLDNFGPRIGFAWQARDKFVVRGGFGFFYDRIAGDRFVHSVEQGNPYGETLDYSGANPYSLANPYPATPPAGVFAARWADPATGAYSLLNTPALDQSLHTPLVRQFNLTLQYQLAQSWVLEAGFVGSSGINLVDTYHDVNSPGLASPSNPINGQTTNTAANAQLRVPYLGYQPAGFQVTAFDGVSNYNSLQVTLRKQFSHGLTMQAAYTWSRDLTTLTSTNFNNISADSNNPSNLGQQYGPAYFSHPQRFIINYSYDLPFGNHKGGLGILANGWNVSGVTTIQDGTPLTISDSGTGTVYGLGSFVNSRAQMCPGMTYANIATPGGVEARLGGPSGGPGYLNINAFCPGIVAPNSPDGSTFFGNTGQGIILGPGQFDFDISILKNFRISKRQQVQFRTEFFNAFNHPQFAPPGDYSQTPPPQLAVSSPSQFGQITNTSVNPRIIQFALKYNF